MLIDVRLDNNFVQTPRKLSSIIGKLTIRKLGSSSMLTIFEVMKISTNEDIISTDEDTSLRIETFAKTNVRGVSTISYSEL